MAMAMAMKKGQCQGRVTALVVVLAMVCALGMMQLQPASAVPVRHNVGGTGLWTVGRKLSYNRWAASKIFRVNDILLFKYSVTFHNVAMVSQAEYMQCKVRKPMAIFRNGAASVKLTKKGRYFFICSVPGHCKAGMKLAITVR